MNTVEVTAARPAQPGRSVDVRPEIDMGVEGITCASSVGLIERAIRKVAGVADVSVDRGSERGHIVVTEQANLGAIKRSVEKAGYESSAFGKVIRDYEAVGLPKRPGRQTDNYLA